MKIEHTITPHNEDINFLTQKINQEVSDKGTAYPFAFFIRDNEGEIIAGCNGSIIFGAIYTDQLWVSPGYRKQGLGQQLMKKVHDYGREIGCRIATCATMSFQGAQKFYETLGYQVDFERLGYVDNSTCIFLRKIL